MLRARKSTRHDSADARASESPIDIEGCSVGSAEPSQGDRGMLSWVHRVWTGWCGSLFEDVDGMSLAVFRVMWGMLLLYETSRYLIDGMKKTRVHFLKPEFMGKYYMFEWVQPYASMQAFLIHLLFVLLMAGCITVGLCYRLACLCFCVGFGYIFLLDSCNYLNHYYLLLLLCFVMAFVPANATLSLDNLFWPAANDHATAPRGRVPMWCISLIRYQFVIVYFFAGLAKINVDWLRGQPLRGWLLSSTDAPVIGPFLAMPLVAYAMAYAGMVYDLLVGFLLMGSLRWRLLGVGLSVIFHIANKLTFNIGIFPWMCLAALPLFYAPDWPRMTWLTASPKLSTENTDNEDYRKPNDSFNGHASMPLRKKLIIACIVFYLGVQIYMPLRYLSYPGDVAWTEYGHKLSWRMKLRDKQCDIRMWLTDGNSSRFGDDVGIEEPDAQGNRTLDVRRYLRLVAILCLRRQLQSDLHEEYRSRRQHKVVLSRPELIHQFAHWIADKEAPASGGSRPKVHVDVWCNLNFRKAGGCPFIDPGVDLAAEDLWAWPYAAVLPLEPLSEEDTSDLPWKWDWADLLWGSHTTLQALRMDELLNDPE